MSDQESKFLQTDQHLISMFRKQNASVKQKSQDARIEARNTISGVYDICVVIPVFGRHDHLRHNLKCLTSQRDSSDLQNAKIQIVVSEMSDSPSHYSLCEEFNVSYVHTKADLFNKSLAMNQAASVFLSESFIFHDVDMITGDRWLSCCFDFLCKKKFARNNSWVLQPIPGRRIFYVSQENTDKIFTGKVALEQIPLGDHKIQPSWYQGNFPPGGSIMISSDLFYAVQGYDPAIFWGYSPEDLCFLKNACMLSQDGELQTWDVSMSEQGCEMYHLYHPETHNTNESYEYMVFIDSMIDGSQIRGFFIHDKMRSNFFDSWSVADQKRYPPHISSIASKALIQNKEDNLEAQDFLNLIIAEINNTNITNTAMIKSYENVIRYAVKNHKYFNACLL